MDLSQLLPEQRFLSKKLNFSGKNEFIYFFSP
jgi:hypothetical protein